MKDLKYRRLLHELSQAKLGKLSGVSRFKISEHECDYYELSSDEYQKIEEVFTMLDKKKGSKDVEQQ